MEQNRNDKQRETFFSFIGKPTPAKASGLAYSVASTLLITFSFFFIVILSVSGATGKEGYQNEDWYLYASFLLSSVAFACTAFWVLRWSKQSAKQALKAQKCHPKYFLIAVILQIGLLSLSELNTLFLEILGKFGYESAPIILPSLDGFGFVGVLLVLAVLPAIFEEIIFRGLLLKGMNGFGTVGAILIGGALFALYHQNPAQTAYQFCCGAAFALVAIRSGSILPTVLSHFINNALILTLQKLEIFAMPQPVYIAVLCISAVCLIGSLVWLIFFEKREMPSLEEGKTAKKERKAFWLTASLGIAVYALTWLSSLVSGL